MLVKANGSFYEKNGTKKKVTASHTFEQGKTYDIPSRAAAAGKKDNYLEILSNAEQVKHAYKKQKAAHNKDQIAEIQAAEKETE